MSTKDAGKKTVKKAKGAGQKGQKKNKQAIVKVQQPKGTAPLQVGTTGADPRLDSTQAAINRKIEDQSPGSITRLQVKATVTDRAIAYLAMGIVLKGIKKGSMSAQQSAEFPYYQWRYLIDVITATMTSGVMLLTTAPRWLWELLYALKPKEEQCKTGTVSYSWRIEGTGQGVDQNFLLGQGEDQYSVFWGTGPAVGEVNGFPVLSALAIPYDPTNTTTNSAALSALWPYLTVTAADIIGDPGADGVSTGKDTSAFAVVYPELGDSYFAEGGVRTTIYSERHIDSPLLCQFARYQPAGSSNWRGWHQARVGSGSPCMIGPMLCDFRSMREMRNKPATIVKYYNFDEFFDQLSLTMCYAQERLAAAGQTPAPCPLTSQTVQILLRQTILQVMNNECVQDVRYSGSSYVDLLPFTVGPNGTLGGRTSSMMLPMFLAENIRACAAVGVKLSKKYGSSLSWIPVLARPPSIQQLGNYTWGANNTLLYNVDVNETPVNLIDVSCTLNQQTLFLDLTRTAYDTYLEVWNAWVTEHTAVLSPLISVSSEKGIRAVNVNLYTNIQETIPNLPEDLSTAGATMSMKKQKSMAKIKAGIDIGKFKTTITVKAQGGYFASVGERKITGNYGFARQLDPIIDNWILPVNYSNDAIEDASTQGYQAFMSEIPSKPRSTSGGIGSPATPAALIPNAYERHHRAALVDVKAFATTDQQNEIILAFQELAKQGRGGFLKSALMGIGNMLMPGLGTAVSEVLGG